MNGKGSLILFWVLCLTRMHAVLRYYASGDEIDVQLYLVRPPNQICAVTLLGEELTTLFMTVANSVVSLSCGHRIPAYLYNIKLKTADPCVLESNFSLLSYLAQCHLNCYREKRNDLPPEIVHYLGLQLHIEMALYFKFHVESHSRGSGV